MDLVRDILFAVEAHPSRFAPRQIEIEGYTEEQIAYHAYIMADAGLADATDATHMQSASPEAHITKLTWAGHDFLDAAREPTRWEQAKEIVRKVGGASIAIWKEILTDILKKNLGIE